MLLQEAKLAGEEQGKVYLYVYLSQPKQYACVIKTIGDDKFIVCVCCRCLQPPHNHRVMQNISIGFNAIVYIIIVFNAIVYSYMPDLGMEAEVSKVRARVGAGLPLSPRSAMIRAQFLKPRRFSRAICEAAAIETVVQEDFDVPVVAVKPSKVELNAVQVTCDV